MSDLGGDPSDDDPATFLRLSEILLDEHDLDPGYAAECMRLVVAAAPPTYGSDPDTTPMQALLATFRELATEPADLAERTTAVLYADGTLGPVTRNILIAWYNGFLGSQVIDAAHYGGALVWPAISAEPPGLPGRFYGNWAYPPPEPIRPGPGS